MQTGPGIDLGKFLPFFIYFTIEQSKNQKNIAQTGNIALTISTLPINILLIYSLMRVTSKLFSKFCTFDKRLVLVVIQF